MKKLILIMVFALANTGCATTSAPWYYRACQIAAAGAHGADLATSEYAFGKGLGRETNHLLEPFQNDPVKFGVGKGVIASAGLVAVDEIPNRKVGAIANCATAVAYGFIVKNNADIIKGVKK